MSSLEASLKLKDNFTQVLNKINNGLQKAAGNMDTFKEKISGPAMAFQALGNAANAGISKLNSSIRSKMSTASNIVKTSTEKILSIFGNFGNRISSSLNKTAFGSKLLSGLNTFKAKATSAFTSVGNALNKLTGRDKKLKSLDTINQQINQLKNKEAKIQINVDGLQNTQNKINKINETISSLQKKKISLKADASATNNVSNRVNIISNAMEKLNNKKAVLEIQANKLDSAKAKLESVQSEIRNLNAQKLSIQTSGLSTALSKVKSNISSIVTTTRSAVSKVMTTLLSSGPAFKQFGSEIKSSFDKINTSVSTVGNKLLNVAKVAAVAGTAALVGIGKKVYDIAGNFDSQMSRVQAISGATGGSFTKLRDQAIDLGAKTAFSASESAKGMEDLASAGFSANEIMAAMPGMLNLAAVSGGDVALAAENSATALRGFGLEASQAGHVSDVFARAAADTNAEVADMGEAMKYIAPVAHSMGIRLEETAAAVGILSDSGIKGAQAGTTLRGALARLAKPTATMQDTMSNLGLSFYDSNGNMKSMTDQVGMLQNAFKGLTPEQQQNALVTLYGQESLSGMMALVAAGPDKLNKLTKSLENSNGAAEEMAKTMQNNLKSKVEQLGGALESVAIRIGDRLFPLIAPQIEKLTTWIDQTFSKVNIDGFFDKLSKYGKVLKGAFDDIKGPVSDAFNAIGDSLEKMNGKFGSAKNVNKFKSALASVTDVIKGIASFAEKHSDGIAKLITNLPKLMAAFVGFKIGSGVLGTIATFGSGIAGAAKATGTLVSNLAKLGKSKTPKTPTVPTPNVPSVGGQGGAATNPFAPLLDTFNGFAKSAGKLAIIFGVIKLIEEAAQALQDINKKVPKDLSSLAPKMLSMGIALTAMGAFVKVASVVAGNNISGAITGLAVVAGISGNLMLAAEALKQINNKVPDSIGDVAKKMGSIAVAIGGMGVLIAAVGAFASTGFGTVAVIAGLVSVAAIAGEMMFVAEAMQQFNSKVPKDISSVKEKIDVIADVISYFTSANLGGVIDLFSNVVGSLNVGAVSSGIKKMQTLAEDLATFGTINFSVTGVTSNISAIEAVINSINSSSIGELLSHIVTSLDYSKVIDVLNSMKKISNQLLDFGSFNFSVTAVTSNISAIEAVVEKLGNSSLKQWFGSMIQSSEVGEALSSIRSMVGMVVPINRLATTAVKADDANSKINLIKQVIEKLGSSSLRQWFGSMIQSSDVGEALSSIRSMVEMVVPINQLATTAVNSADAIGKINLISDVLKSLSPANFGTVNAVSADAISSASSALQGAINLVPKINQLASTEVQSLQAQTVIQGIRNVLNELASLSGSSVTIAIGGFEMLSASMASVVSSGQALTASLSQVQSSIAGLVTTVQTAGGQIVTVMTQSMTQARTAVVSGTQAMATAFASGMSLSVSVVIAGNARIVGAFSGLRGQLQSAGYYAMSGLAAGIAAGSGSAIAQAQSVANQVSSTIRSALKIHSPSRVMMEIGRFVGQGLANGIAATQNLVSKVSNALAFSAVPNPVADLSANGTVTSNVKLDDSEISRLQVSASQPIVVNNKQVVPQVTINVEAKDGKPIDTEALLQEFEDKIIELMDSDLS